jgi:transposase
VACEVIAPSLTPVRPGDRIKTDRRNARKLVRLFRAGELTCCTPPSPEQEGLRDLMRCREDLRRGRVSARHRVAKQLLRHGRVFREGKGWTIRHRDWVARQRLADPLAQRALEHMRAHLEGLDAQIAALDHEIDQIAASGPWAESVAALCCFRGIAARTALGLVAEIGDFRRFGQARELMSFLGLTPSEYSSGPERHAGTSPRPATSAPAACWWRRPGTTAIARLAAPASARPSWRWRPSAPRAPTPPKCACTTATGALPNTASAPPSRTSRWRASWWASSGRR